MVYNYKHIGSKRLVNDVSCQGRTLEGLKKLICKIEARGSFAREPGIGGPHIANQVRQVEQLINLSK